MRKFKGGAEKEREKKQEELRLKQLVQKTPKLDFIWGKQPYYQEQGEVIDSASELPLTSDDDLSETFAPETVSQNEISSCDFITAKSMLQDDLGLWDNVTEEVCNYWIERGSRLCQHSDYDFSESCTTGGHHNRFCSLSLFTRVHSLNSEKTWRSWLCYSPSKRRLYCFRCKIFSKDDLQFVHGGFSDWGNGQRSISRHEKGNSHLSAMYALISRALSLSRIDTDLAEQLKADCDYWKNVLQRIVDVVKFLAERGLPFRGHDDIIGSQANGNYLGILELISQFDSFIAAHIDKYGNRGRGHVSYLSSNVCDEFIQIMGQKLFRSIIDELKRAKYFSVSIDSTPDITHIDQLTCVLRYVLDDGPVERFVKFIEIGGHTGEELANSLILFLEQAGININDCRGQSYDNASNMSGKYIGVQALVREKNPKADYIPCFTIFSVDPHTPGRP